MTRPVFLFVPCPHTGCDGEVEMIRRQGPFDRVPRWRSPGSCLAHHERFTDAEECILADRARKALNAVLEPAPTNG